MEIAIAVFVGIWLSGFSVWGYLHMKKEFQEVNLYQTKSGKQNR